jgi:hypothetical protein
MARMTRTDAATRPLSDEEKALIDKARERAESLYRGDIQPHHSCGASLARTFDLNARPYQALRRGGISGERFCGSLRGGELVLGELLGDPDPTGAVTDELRAATLWFQEQIPRRFDRGSSPDYACNNLTAPKGDFMGPERKSFCTSWTGEVAALAAEAVIRFSPDYLLRISTTED